MGFVVVQASLNGGTAPGVQISKALGIEPIRRVEEEIALGHAFVFPEIGGQEIIDGLRGQALQFRVKEGAFRHGTNVHIPEPLVYDEIAGDVPEFGVPVSQAGLVSQGGVKVLMSQHKTPFHFFRPAAGLT